MSFRGLTRHTASGFGPMHAFVVALLVWVQLFAPFVHAHAGAARTGGWHLHTAAAASTLADVREAGFRRAPDGHDSPDIGLSAGVLQSRVQLSACAHPAGHDAEHPPSAMRACVPAAQAPAPILLPHFATLLPQRRPTGRPGLPALPHAPPTPA